MGESGQLSERQLGLIAKALADPRRRDLLRQIAAKPKGILCAEIRECQAITAATVSHHLKELETSGLISIARRGKFAELKADRSVLKRYISSLREI